MPFKLGARTFLRTRKSLEKSTLRLKSSIVALLIRLPKEIKPECRGLKDFVDLYMDQLLYCNTDRHIVCLPDRISQGYMKIVLKSNYMKIVLCSRNQRVAMCVHLNNTENFCPSNMTGSEH